jgi:hypothetical protein
MRKTVFALTVIFLFLPCTHARAEELPPPIRVVMTVLGLSEDQTHALIASIQAREAAIHPLAVQIATRQEALGHLAESAAPDPAEAGRLFLEIHTLERQMQNIAQASAGAFEQTLNDEQRARLNGLRHAAPVCEVLPALRAVGLL